MTLQFGLAISCLTLSECFCANYFNYRVCRSADMSFTTHGADVNG